MRLARGFATLASSLVALLAAGTLGAPDASAASAALAWDANTEADLLGYKIYYDVDSGAPYSGAEANEGASPIDVPLASLADTSMPALTLTGLASCTRYYFAVTAYSSGGESAFSAEIPATVVQSPTPVLVTAGDGALELSWTGLPADDDGAVDAYTVLFDTDAGDPYAGAGSPASVPAFDPASPSFELGGLVNGTTYYLVVEASCPDATTKRSAEVTGTPAPGGGGGGTSSGSGGGASTSGPGTGAGGDASSGSGGDGTGGSANEEDGDGGGCSCRTTTEASSSGAAGLLALCGAVALAGRRRRRTR